MLDNQFQRERVEYDETKGNTDGEEPIDIFCR